MAFWEWVKFAEKSGIPEFENCARTYRNWSEGILNTFKYGFTNGPIEGYNNKIKVLIDYRTELGTLRGSVPELYTALSDKKRSANKRLICCAQKY
jgi:hypothetical protein